MEGHSLDTKNGANTLSNPDDCTGTARPRAIIDVNIIGPARADWAVHVQKIPFDHGLKPDANIVSAGLELGEPGLLTGPYEFQNMVLDGVESFHVLRVDDLENEMSSDRVVGMHRHDRK